MNTTRFVVLKHFVTPNLARCGGDHLDWMFHIGDALRTWATPLTDRFDQPLQLDAYPLADHRIVYLDYQGELSDDRGSVHRLLAGQCEVLREDEQRFVARLQWRSEARMERRLLICQRTSSASDTPPAAMSAGWSLSLCVGR
jgi:hypothetical protein